MFKSELHLLLMTYGYVDEIQRAFVEKKEQLLGAECASYYPVIRHYRWTAPRPVLSYV